METFLERKSQNLDIFFLVYMMDFLTLENNVFILYWFCSAMNDNTVFEYNTKHSCDTQSLLHMSKSPQALSRKYFIALKYDS